MCTGQDRALKNIWTVIQILMSWVLKISDNYYNILSYILSNTIQYVLGMLQDNARLVKIIGSKQEKSKLKEGIWNKICVFFNFLLIIDYEFEALLSL